MPKNFFKSLVAVVAGNIVFLLLEPHLPAAARHRPLRFDLGLLVDFWVCVVAYGVLGLFWKKRGNNQNSDVH